MLAIQLAAIGDGDDHAPPGGVDDTGEHSGGIAEVFEGLDQEQKVKSPGKRIAQ